MDACFLTFSAINAPNKDSVNTVCRLCQQKVASDTLCPPAKEAGLSGFGFAARMTLFVSKGNVQGLSSPTSTLGVVVALVHSIMRARLIDFKGLGDCSLSFNFKQDKLPGILPQTIINMDEGFSVLSTHKTKGTVRSYLPDPSTMAGFEHIAGRQPNQTEAGALFLGRLACGNSCLLRLGNWHKVNLESVGWIQSLCRVLRTLRKLRRGDQSLPELLCCHMRRMQGPPPAPVPVPDGASSGGEEPGAASTPRFWNLQDIAADIYPLTWGARGQALGVHHFFGCQLNKQRE
jgi:hypothetical protein